MMLGEAGRNPPGKDRVSRLSAGSPGCGLAVANGVPERLGIGPGLGVALGHGVGLVYGVRLV
jgi:hypothetical protein